MWTALGYAWRVTTQIFYFLVVWYVLEQLHDRLESVIIPVLGLLYVAVRSAALSVSWTTIHIGVALDEINERLKTLCNATYQREKEVSDEIQRRFKQTNFRLYIELGGQSLIGLLCLWKLFTEL
jgi:hypothetical protein